MSLLERGDKAYLLLADGTIFEGLHFGVKGTAIGEVVFTTGMTAYQETLTDPSYYGQLVTQTFPLIGNYGVHDDNFFNLLKGNHLWGGSLGYAYNSIFGPMNASFGLSNRAQKLQFFLNLGYYF